MKKINITRDDFDNKVSNCNLIVFVISIIVFIANYKNKGKIGFAIDFILVIVNMFMSGFTLRSVVDDVIEFEE